ncbi:GNAT family N-acetyltransferase [Agromyces lapidis]|uniref:GNAT family N-acetyltransferase n=1 Tax=Agromyces lapidis TaxID=279574 RepID=A0ABV5STE7_9MICO|nr:GNAT family N-acetyltransferase [Agromyces lapidis]
MLPVELRTARLVLDLPVEDDVERVARYCQDPLFEQFLTTPWPYTEAHARGFLTEHVPSAWQSGSELTWAIRTESGGRLIGVISLRAAGREVGYWLGDEHRGSAYTTEALGAVCAWAVEHWPGTETVTWRANAGNVASAMVARAAGFRNTTTATTTVPGRDGAELEGWSGERGRIPAADAVESWVPLLGGAE